MLELIFEELKNKSKIILKEFMNDTYVIAEAGVNHNGKIELAKNE